MNSTITSQPVTTAEAPVVSTGLDEQQEIRYRELRSCCWGTLYGYMDQYGREYDTDKVMLTAGQKLTDPDAE
jgi:hypothetical protein